MRLPSNNVPIRSQHFAPGTSMEVMKKAAACDADEIVLELEDGVAPSKKVEARANIVRALNGDIDFGKKSVLVRINHLDTEWGKDDLAAIKALPRLNGIVLPKVETVEYVQDVIKEAPDKPLWFTYETTKGKRAMPQILQSLKDAGQISHIKGMIFGNNDYSAQFPGIHADDRDNLVLKAARANMLELAHEFELVAIDGPSRNLIPEHDLDANERFYEDCTNGRRDGFDGKQTINLNQIRTVNGAFSPTARELENANRLKLAYEKALLDEKGAVNVSGSMTEKMHYAAALATLRLQEAIEKLEVQKKQGVAKN